MAGGVGVRAVAPSPMQITITGTGSWAIAEDRAAPLECIEGAPGWSVAAAVVRQDAAPQETLGTLLSCLCFSLVLCAEQRLFLLLFIALVSSAFVTHIVLL